MTFICTWKGIDHQELENIQPPAVSSCPFIITGPSSQITTDLLLSLLLTVEHELNMSFNCIGPLISGFFFNKHAVSPPCLQVSRLQIPRTTDMEGWLHQFFHTVSDFLFHGFLLWSLLFPSFYLFGIRFALLFPSFLRWKLTLLMLGPSCAMTTPLSTTLNAPHTF